MTRYVKKRIPIEAVQSGVVSNAELRKFANFLVILDHPEDDGDTGYYAVFDRLHDTWVRFEPGDWILRGIQGEYYPCKKDIFEETYEVFDESAAL